MGRVQAGRTVQTLGIVSTADYTGSELARGPLSLSVSAILALKQWLSTCLLPQPCNIVPGVLMSAQP